MSVNFDEESWCMKCVRVPFRNLQVSVNDSAGNQAMRRILTFSLHALRGVAVSKHVTASTEKGSH